MFWAKREKVGHSALAQSDYAEEESVEVTSGSLNKQECTPSLKDILSGQARWTTSSDGTNSPGCCPITVGGKKLLLACNRTLLSVNPFPTLGRPDDIDQSAADPLSIVAAPGHDISCFVKDPTADAVFSGSYAGEVIQWNVKSQSVTMRLRRDSDQEAHDGGVKALCVIGSLAGGSSLIVTGGVDGAIRLWDAHDGTLWLELTRSIYREGKDRPAHDGGVGTLCIVRDGIIASGGKDGVIRLWNTSDGTLVQELWNTSDETLIQELRSVAHDDEVERKDLLAHDGGVQALRVISRGQLVSGGKDGAVRLWSLIDGTFQQELRRVEGDDEAEGTDRPAHDRGIRSIYECKDGLIATGAEDGAVRLWGVDGKLCRELKRKGGQNEAEDADRTAHDGWVWNICELEHQVLASAGADEHRAWSTTNGKLLSNLSDSAASASVTATGILARGDRNGAIKLCSTASGVKMKQQMKALYCGRMEIEQLSAHDGPVWTVCALSDDMIASGGQDKAIRFWNITDKKNPTLQLELKRSEGGKTTAHDAAVKVLCVVEDGLLASGGQDGAVRLWKMDDGTLLRELRREGGKDGAEGAYRLAHDRCMAAICGVRHGLVATGGKDGAIRLWSTVDGTLQREMRRVGPNSKDLPACDGWVYCIRRVKDGLIVSAGQDGKVGSVGAAGVVRLWNIDDGTLEREMRRPGRKKEAKGTDMPAHQNSARAVCVVRDAQIGMHRYPEVIVTGGDDSALRLWNVADGTLLHELHERVLVSQLWEWNGVLYCQDVGEVYALPMKQMQSRLHFNIFVPVVDLNDLFDKFVALTKPKIHFGLRAMGFIITPCQVVSFCITASTSPMLPKEVEKSFKFAQDLGFTSYEVTLSFECVYYCTVGLAMVFTFVMFYKERLEYAVFLQPRSSSRYWWLLAKFYTEALSTVFFVSIFKTLLRGLDCTQVDEGIWSFDPLQDQSLYYNENSSESSIDLEMIDVGLECYSSEHIVKFLVPSWICILAFGCLSLRLLFCGAQLSALEIRMNPFDCSKDSRITREPHLHQLSIKSKDFRVALVLLKMCVAVVDVVCTRYPLVYSATLLATTVGTVSVLVHSPPYHNEMSNLVQQRLLFGATACALAETVVTIFGNLDSSGRLNTSHDNMGE